MSYKLNTSKWYSYPPYNIKFTNQTTGFTSEFLDVERIEDKIIIKDFEWLTIKIEALV
jgi:hypothetical protein